MSRLWLGQQVAAFTALGVAALSVLCCVSFGAPFKRLAVGLAFALSCGMAAGASAPGGSLKWPAAPNSARAGAFAVVQVATVNEAEFVATWRKPGPHVHENVTTRPRRGQTLATFIAFTGCQADKRGDCNVTVTYKLYDPSGKLIGQPTLEVWSKKPRPNPQFVSLSVQSMALGFTQTDPLGAYVIEATVIDHVAGVTLHTRQVHNLST